MNDRLIIETYIAYLLCNKSVLTIGNDDEDDGLKAVIRNVLKKEQNKEASDRYIRRCIADLKIIGALTKKAKVRHVLDNTEVNYWESWEEEFYRPENISYLGRGRNGDVDRYRNINFAHLSPVDYTFTLDDYSSIVGKTPQETLNLQKLYRIVMTINSEYSEDDDELDVHVKEYLKKYISTFKEEDDVIGDFFETLNYIRQAITLHGMYDEDIEGFERQNGTQEEILGDLEFLLFDFKQTYGFNADEIDLSSCQRNRRRYTEPDKNRIRRKYY